MRGRRLRRASRSSSSKEKESVLRFGGAGRQAAGAASLALRDLGPASGKDAPAARALEQRARGRRAAFSSSRKRVEAVGTLDDHQRYLNETRRLYELRSQKASGDTARCTELSIVLPAYNEEANIDRGGARRWSRYLDPHRHRLRDHRRSTTAAATGPARSSTRLAAGDPARAAAAPPAEPRLRRGAAHRLRRGGASATSSTWTATASSTSTTSTSFCRSPARTASSPATASSAAIRSCAGSTPSCSAAGSCASCSACDVRDLNCAFKLIPKKVLETASRSSRPAR